MKLYFSLFFSLFVAPAFYCAPLSLSSFHIVSHCLVIHKVSRWYGRDKYNTITIKKPSGFRCTVLIPPLPSNERILSQFGYWSEIIHTPVKLLYSRAHAQNIDATWSKASRKLAVNEAANSRIQSTIADEIKTERREKTLWLPVTYIQLGWI